MLAGAIIKIAHEQFFGASEDVSSLINATVAIEAHFWGVISGVIFFCISLIKAKAVKNNHF